METQKKVIKYPENLALKEAVQNSGITIKHISKLIGYSRHNISQTINGHYKGANIKPKINEVISTAKNSLGLGSGVN